MSVLVCRGCCCGTAAKHPDVDHDAQLRQLRASLPATVPSRLWQVDCLDACERSDVVVARSGATRRWFGGVLSTDDTAAVSSWIADGAGEVLPEPVAALEFRPDAASAVVDPLDTGGMALVDVAAGWLSTGSGAWTVGVPGAVGEYAPLGGSVVRRRGGVVEEVGDDGALRLTVGPSTVAYAVRDAGDPTQLRSVILAEPVAPAPAGVGAVTELGPDPDPLRPDDAGKVLVDLGLGRCDMRSMVRTADPGLLAILRRAGGPSWEELMAAHGAEVVRTSPHRVLERATARLEVYSPIPPPDGRSPVGSHTHLLAAHLELGRDLPVGVCLPTGMAPVAEYHLPPSAPPETVPS